MDKSGIRCVIGNRGDDSQGITEADRDFFANIFNLIPPKFFCEKTLVDDGDLERELTDKQKAKKRKRSGGDQAPQSKRRTITGSTAADLSELQHKLQDKLTELRGNRHASEDRTALLRRRKQSRDKRQKRKQNKQLKQASQAPTTTAASAPVKSSKRVYNSDGHVVFSKFDFTQNNSKKRSASASDFSGKNYKKLLLKVQKRAEKEKRLEETDADAAKAFKEKTQWQTVLQKAEGQKVKDNPELLKKALKRKEKLKAVSARKWEERAERTEKRMRDKQDKRRANIKKKKDGRINKKMKRAKKKGHIIPGF